MTEEELREIGELAELFFSNEELAVLLAMPVAELRLALTDPENQLGAVITKSRLLSEAELRKSILLLAKRGSSPAQATAIKLLERMQAET